MNWFRLMVRWSNLTLDETVFDDFIPFSTWLWNVLLMNLVWFHPYWMSCSHTLCCLAFQDIFLNWFPIHLAKRQSNIAGGQQNSWFSIFQWPFFSPWLAHISKTDSPFTKSMIRILQPWLLPAIVTIVNHDWHWLTIDNGHDSHYSKLSLFAIIIVHCDFYVDPWFTTIRCYHSLFVFMKDCSICFDLPS